MDCIVSDFPSRFKELLATFDLTNAEAGKRIGVSRQTISAWSTGVRTPKRPVIAQIASLFDVSFSWLNGYDVPMRERSAAPTFPYPSMLPIKSRKRVPILGSAACGEPIYKPGDGTEFVDIEDDLPCDFALVAEGDSMIGDRILSGDVVFFRYQADANDGDVVAVAIDDEVMIKHISRVRDASGNVLYTFFSSSNPKYDPIPVGGENETRAVHILGKAVAFRSLM